VRTLIELLFIHNKDNKPNQGAIKASASKMGEEEEGLAVLIYKSSKTAKARAAEAVAAAAAASAGSRTSTRRRSSATQGNEASIDRRRKKIATNGQKFNGENKKSLGKSDWRKYVKICSIR
jgi:hypothetical protein